MMPTSVFISDNILCFEDLAVTGRLSAFSGEVIGGELVHLIGPNGAGKSTLLARIATLLSGGGTVRVQGEVLDKMPLKQRACVRGYLPQQQAPVMLMPVHHYLDLHKPRGTSVYEIEAVVHYLAQQLGLQDKLARPITHLSGGEWQRVRVAAILLQVWPTLNPHSRILILDEPMAGLDVAQQLALDRLLKAFCDSGRIVISSGHDLNHTLRRAARVWLLSQGKVVEQGLAEQVITPQILQEVFGVPFVQHQGGSAQRWVIPQELD